MKKAKEEPARIPRENGAKSRGPVTEERKAKVSFNALNHGEYSEKLAALVLTHFAADNIVRETMETSAPEPAVSPAKHRKRTHRMRPGSHRRRLPKRQIHTV